MGSPRLTPLATLPARSRFAGGAVAPITALILLTALAYLRTAANGFAPLDDHRYVTNNAYVKSGLTVAGVRYAWTTLEGVGYMPLTWLSLMLNVELFGAQAWGFHLVDALLHATNSVLYFILLRRWTGAQGLSFVAAALFAVHPLHVESVAWISERKDTLSLLFGLCSLLAYSRFARNGERLAWALAFACFLAGLLAKSMLVTWPALLLLMDWWPLRRWSFGEGVSVLRRASRLGLEKIPFLLASIGMGVITVIGQQAYGGLTLPERIPLWSRIALTPIAYVWYLWKSVWPMRLSAFYPHPGVQANIGVAAGAALLLLALTTLLLSQRRRHPELLFGWLWFLVALAPVIGIVQVGLQAYADRYSYLPHVGLLITLVWGARALALKCSIRPGLQQAAAVAATVFFLGLTFMQVGVWRNGLTLWSQALSVDNRNWFAHRQIAAEWLARGELEPAEQHLAAANALLPDDPKTLRLTGNLYVQEQRYDDAAPLLERSLAQEPDSAEAWLLLAMARRETGDAPRAAQAIERALAYAPDHALAWREQALIALQQGDFSTARAAALQVRALVPDLAEAWRLSAEIEAASDQPTVARAFLEEAFARAPQSFELNWLAAQLAEQEGDHAAALKFAKTTLQFNPRHAAARELIERLNMSGK